MSNLGKTFNQIAEDYKSYRPVYPLEFIQNVLAVLPNSSFTNICEIGCGTGQATTRLAELGYQIQCVEPGDELRKIAQEDLKKFPKVTFIADTFENAELQSESFDLVFACQSLHWVDPVLRFKKSWEILKPKGHFLAVWRWNLPLDGSLGEKLNDIFSSSVPDFRLETPAEYEQGVISNFNDLINSGFFIRCQLRRMPYDWDKLSQDYVNGISTWSQLAALSPEKRIEVCHRVTEEIDSVGGRIKESGETVIITGQKSG